MIYAIISDIHGNKFAFEAVLADAVACGAEKFLLIGDYTNSFPWGNEVAERIRTLRNATVVRGNGEGYLENLRQRDPVTFVDQQFKPVYWAYQSLSAENLAYMTTLLETAIVDEKINLQHAMDIFHHESRREWFSSFRFRHDLSREEYLKSAREFLLTDENAMAQIRSLDEGVYLFGHNHVQFFAAVEGRLFINPGSCGEPLDGDTRASYTLLLGEGTNWRVEERRVVYDREAVRDAIVSSGYAKYTPVWSHIMMQELDTAQDHFYKFVVNLTETAQKLGVPSTHDKAWEAACAKYFTNM